MGPYWCVYTWQAIQTALMNLHLHSRVASILQYIYTSAFPNIALLQIYHQLMLIISNIWSRQGCSLLFQQLSPPMSHDVDCSLTLSLCIDFIIERIPCVHTIAHHHSSLMVCRAMSTLWAPPLQDKDVPQSAVQTQTQSSQALQNCLSSNTSPARRWIRNFASQILYLLKCMDKILFTEICAVMLDNCQAREGDTFHYANLGSEKSRRSDCWKYRKLLTYEVETWAATASVLAGAASTMSLSGW